ncbi:hypothetical protein HanRHA438_Chr05g0211541 [Helianthus annuus]|nr:hypothetical protein HanRHA438_Chr05g0211541 [Helianthus annuus]
MNSLTIVNIPFYGNHRQYSSHGEPTRDIPIRTQLPQTLQRITKLPNLSIPINHSIPQHNISLRHFIKHLVCIPQQLKLQIPMNHSTSHKQIMIQPKLKHQPMNPPQPHNIPTTQIRLNHTRKSKSIHHNPSHPHFIKHLQCRFWHIIVNKASNDCVVCENIGFRG